MAPSSDRKRIAERNLILTPDCGIIELTLQHTGKLKQQTTVQLRAIYANSFSSAPLCCRLRCLELSCLRNTCTEQCCACGRAVGMLLVPATCCSQRSVPTTHCTARPCPSRAACAAARIDGDYLVPPAVERNGLRVVPGFAEQDKYDARTGGVGIPAGRQAVTVVTPLFTLWVWPGLPEWPAHPARVPEAYPSLHLRITLPQMPVGQVHPPLSCRLHSSWPPGPPWHGSAFV